MYPVISVLNDASDLPEQLGTKRKFWYRTGDGQVFLFKEGRPNTGENWAEKVCCELCRLIGIPHANYELATWKDHKGVVTPKFVPDDGRLVLGNELLAKIIKDYPHEVRYKARQHTVTVVMAILSWPEIGKPLDYDMPNELALARDVFVGYLMLDALVANQDRHHENWGLISSPSRQITLAPSFDHAASLGRNELDAVRMRRLKTSDKGDSMERYVERAASAFYPSLKGQRPQSTLTAFEDAARQAPKAAAYWLKCLGSTTIGDYEAVFKNIPDSEITEPASQFALRMLELNRKRLLEM
jgi:HipA-like C-terminal domain.